MSCSIESSNKNKMVVQKEKPLIKERGREGRERYQSKDKTGGGRFKTVRHTHNWTEQQPIGEECIYLN